MQVEAAPPAKREPPRVESAPVVRAPEERGAETGGTLIERVARACPRPMLSAVLSRATLERGVAGDYVLVVEPGKRGLVEGAMVEVKGLVRQVLGEPAVEVRLGGGEDRGGDESGVGANAQASSSASRTSMDREFEHPLVKQVAELFDAVPRRVEPKQSGRS